MEPLSNKAQAVKAELSARFSGLNFEAGGGCSRQGKLAACVAEVDDFLEGGLPFGGVTEFGVPLGKEGRILIARFLANATRGLRTEPLWTLWVSSHRDFSVFPPAWFVRGISPARMVFAHSEVPVRDLKRAIVNPLFRLIVLDSPQAFSRDDCFFVNRQARSNRQLVILLRNFFLSNRQGNVWAKLRINCWKRHASGQFVLRVIRGLSYRQLSVSEELLQ
ncbi:MAG: hypothetical protein GY866_24825 [Proteobacteria bacterium]|nr:hypothetical protein [Pseudomonadota bacterium]